MQLTVIEKGNNPYRWGLISFCYLSDLLNGRMTRKGQDQNEIVALQLVLVNLWVVIALQLNQAYQFIK